MGLSKRYPSKRRRATRRADRLARARANASCMGLAEYFEASHRLRWRGWDLLARETLEPILEQMRATLADMGEPSTEAAFSAGMRIGKSGASIREFERMLKNRWLPRYQEASALMAGVPLAYSLGKAEAGQ